MQFVQKILLWSLHTNSAEIQFLLQVSCLHNKDMLISAINLDLCLLLLPAYSIINDCSVCCIHFHLPHIKTLQMKDIQKGEECKSREGELIRTNRRNQGGRGKKMEREISVQPLTDTFPAVLSRMQDAINKEKKRCHWFFPLPLSCVYLLFYSPGIVTLPLLLLYSFGI